MNQPDYEVVICGAGPVGLLTGCLLGSYGIKALIIEKHTQILDIPRAIALDEEAQRILDGVGVYDQLAAHSPRIDTVIMHSHILGELMHIDCTQPKNGYPRIITFYQPGLERLLNEKLRDYPNVELQRGVSLEHFTQNAGLVTCHTNRVKQSTVRTRFLLGCDGANSTVRSGLNIPMMGQPYGQNWLIVDALNDPLPDARVQYIGNPYRPVVTMPGPQGRRRWEFLLQPGEQPNQVQSPQFLQELLASWGDCEQMQIERTVVYNFQSGVASGYSNNNIPSLGSPNVFLLGDAAHVTPPFIGQGLCAGLRDAWNLAWKLAWVSKGWAGSHILKTYEPERKPHAWGNIRLAGLFGRLFTSTRPLQAALVAGLVRSLLSVPGLGRRLQSVDLKPANRLQNGLFLQCLAYRLTGRAQGTTIGSFLDTARPNDAALGNNLVLISDRALGAGRANIRQPSRPSPGKWAQVGGQTLSPTAVHSPPDQAVIVRPDRVVAAAGPAQAAGALANDFARLLLTG